MAPKGPSRPKLLPLAHLTHETAFSPATVSVRNLSCTSSAALDAWGRPGKSQPLLVSASVSFRQPFSAASASDSVTGGDTVHYGEMSKEILAAVKRGTDSTLSAQLETACAVLTGKRLSDPSKVLMDKTKVKAFDVRVLLPKASLMGEGVSLRTLAVLGEEGRTERYGCVLKLHRLRVPVLVGVNANERERKQIVVADVEIDQWDHKYDVYTELEEIVVKVMEGSEFETLEALAALLAHTIMAEFCKEGLRRFKGEDGWQLSISLEKPTAVTFAEGPVVQIRAGGGFPDVVLPPNVALPPNVGFPTSDKEHAPPPYEEENPWTSKTSSSDKLE